jgi:hypothetical protein
MPKLLGSRLIPSIRKGNAYLLNDTFTTTRAAGAINGTLAEPGPGTRTVVDTNSKLTIASGDLTFATGGVGNGDPGYWLNSFQRVLGALVVGSVTVTSGTIEFGIDSIALGAPNDSVRLSNSVVVRVSAATIAVGAASFSQNYQLVMAVRLSGVFYFIKGGAYTNLTLLYVSITGTYSTIFPGYMSVGTTSVGTCAHIRYPPNRWVPIPLVSDGFSAWGTTDGLGHAEGVAGGLGAGGSGKTWTLRFGTFQTSGGVANATSLSSSVAIATLDCGSADAILSANLVWLAGTTGFVLRWVDNDNCIRYRHTGTNVQLVKVVAGVATTVLDAAATYVSGARLMIVCEGTKFRCFYNELAVSTEQTISDAVLQSSTLVGLRTSDLTNTYDDFLVYARGTGGEYAALDSF